MTETSTDLIDTSKIKAVDIYEKDGGVEGVLNMVRQAVADFEPDTTSRMGRMEIAAIAARVARSKTFLDGQGKEMVDEMKAVTGAIDAKRKHIRDTLDALKKDVRRPLTEWEEAEQERVDAHHSMMRSISDIGSYALLNWDTIAPEAMNEKLIVLESTSRDIWEEYEDEATQVLDHALAAVRSAIEKRGKSDAEKAEAHCLREEAAERKKADDEAAAKKRQEERDAQVQEEADERVAAAEKEAEEAKATAETEAKEKAEAEQKARDQAERERAADEKHRTNIENAAFDALVAMDIEGTEARSIILAIARGNIPNVKITY